MQEYLQALTELVPSGSTRKRSIEAVKAAAKELESVKIQLESERAKREEEMAAERKSMQAA